MALYRLIAALVWVTALALLGPRSLAARLAGRPLPDAERLLPPSRRTGDGPLLWLHGASNGELTAARPLLAAIRDRWPDLALLVTVNNPTARAMVAGWGLPGLAVRLAPLDAGPPTRALLDRLRPSALVVIENELWPIRLQDCARRKIPVLVAGARMSERSARRWGRLRRLVRPALAAVRWLAPQDEASRDRLVALGLDPARIGPPLTLKAAAARPASAPGGLPFDRAMTLLAASTHEGEEEMILDAFRAARAAHPDLRLILAPRHPRRGPDLARLAAARGLACRTRSAGQQPHPDAPVYLADTLGEMGLWYAAAGLCLVGGSLVDRGGHTPFEPAEAGAVILHGPHTANFAAAYAALDGAGAAQAVADAAGLASALFALAGDRAAQDRLADRARTALAPFGQADAAGQDAFLAVLARTLGRAT
jgi:3-deoxy-D-manno-octulosonic-acid transferase